MHICRCRFPNRRLLRLPILRTSTESVFVRPQIQYYGQHHYIQLYPQQLRPLQQHLSVNGQQRDSNADLVEIDHAYEEESPNSSNKHHHLTLFPSSAVTHRRPFQSMIELITWGLNCDCSFALCLLSCSASICFPNGAVKEQLDHMP